jgi:hypothetical protein
MHAAGVRSEPFPMVTRALSWFEANLPTEAPCGSLLTPMPALSRSSSSTSICTGVPRAISRFSHPPSCPARSEKEAQ